MLIYYDECRVRVYVRVRDEIVGGYDIHLLKK